MDKSMTPRQIWEASFQEQIESQAYNTSPVEALVRNAAYYLRARHKPADHGKLHFLEMGCGAGPNLMWLAQKGIRVSGIDISPRALALCRENFKRAGLEDKMVHLLEGSVDKVPLPDGSVDGIFESCVFQHLDLETRKRTFNEVRRLLKPGGLFAGHMLDAGHTIFRAGKGEAVPGDPGTLILDGGGSKFHLGNIGLSHFYRREELKELLAGFSAVDPCLTTYYLPAEEAKRRGYDEYLQSMWAVYAVK